MTPEYEQEIAAHLERAEQSIQAAKDLVVKGYYDFAASRIMQPFTEPQRFCSKGVWISASIAGSLLRFISDLSRRGN